MSKVPEDEDISELTVPEDAIVGTKISQVKATDVDAGGTMMVHYKIDRRAFQTINLSIHIYQFLKKANQ